MICPFIIGTKLQYQTVKNKDGETEYLETAQVPFFPDCYQDDCPFYTWNGRCGRVGDD